MTGEPAPEIAVRAVGALAAWPALHALTTLSIAEQRRRFRPDWAPPEPERVDADLFERVVGGARFWLAVEGGRAVGLLAAEERVDRWEVPAEELWIVDLYVLPEARRRGAARLLLAAVVGFAAGRRIKLGVLPNNPAARALYAATGFSEVRTMLRLERRAD